MYEKKVKITAISAIVAAGLLVGLMIILPFLITNNAQTNGFAVFFMFVVSMFGDIAVYASAISFVIVAIVFSTRLLKTQSLEMLISYNKRLLIATYVLLPFLAAGMIANGGFIYPSKLGLFPLVYTIVASIAYLTCLIAQILSMSALKSTQNSK